MSSEQSQESNTDTRKAILEKLEAGMDDLSQAIDAVEPSTMEEEQLQLRRYHELGYLANQYRKLKKDTDISEMDERLELIENHDIIED